MRKLFRRAAAVAAMAVVLVLGAGVASAEATASGPMPAQSVDSIITYGCNPSGAGWETKAAWADGTVAEGRGCLQHDSATGKVRARAEFRVRKGGTPISGADWDLNPDFMMRVHDYTQNTNIGVLQNFADTFNASYIARYSAWACVTAGPADHTYIGSAFDFRVTPPGLPKSSPHDQFSYQEVDQLILC